MKRYLTNNILLKITSVIFAVMLWLIVLNIDDPNTSKVITNIPIQIENANAITDLNKVYTVVAGDTASVSVTGPRSIVDKLSASDFVATADFTELSTTNAVPITVEVSKSSYRDKVTVFLKTNTMRLSIEDIEEKEFSIEVSNIGFLSDGYVIYENNAADKMVTVYAPTSVMNTIAHVKAMVPAEGQSDDFVSNIILICTDADGREIQMDKNNITMSALSTTVKSTVYYSKKVAVKEEFANVVPNGYSILGNEISNTEVTIVGKKKDVLPISELIIPSDLLEVVSNTKDYEIKCNIQDMLPDGVYAFGEVLDVTVKLHIDRTVSRSYNIDVKKLGLINIPADYDASIVTKGTFVYTLAGLEENIKEYDTQESYNVSLEGLGEGTHTVEVTIEVPNGMRLVEKVYVEVKLSKAGDEPTTTTRPNTETTTEEQPATGGVEETTTPAHAETSGTEKATIQ